METAIGLVLDDLFLVTFEKTSWPNHHWRPKHNAPISNDGLILFKRGLRCCGRDWTNQQAARFTDYRQLALLAGRFLTRCIELELRGALHNLLVNRHIRTINAQKISKFLTDFGLVLATLILSRFLSTRVCLPYFRRWIELCKNFYYKTMFWGWLCFKYWSRTVKTLYLLLTSS